MASIASVRARGLFAEYERALPAQYKDALLGAVAATWIPLDVARAHYAACDSFGLGPEQQAQSGRTTFEGARGTILGTAVRMARGAGFTPWVALSQLQRFWDRGFDGGAVSVIRVGPKDAHASVQKCALVESPYFRNGLRGLLGSLMNLFCTKAYVTDRRLSSADAVSFRVQWA